MRAAISSGLLTALSILALAGCSGGAAPLYSSPNPVAAGQVGDAGVDVLIPDAVTAPWGFGRDQQGRPLASTCHDTQANVACIAVSCLDREVLTINYQKTGGGLPQRTGVFQVVTRAGVKESPVDWALEQTVEQQSARLSPALADLLRRGSHGVYRDADKTLPFTLKDSSKTIAQVEAQCRG